MSRKDQRERARAGAGTPPVSPVNMRKGPFQQLVEKQPTLSTVDLRNARIELVRKIQAVRQRPLVIYATNTELALPGIPAYIHRQDIIPFGEVLDSVQGDVVDVLLETPGGLAEVTVEIVNLLRPRFRHVAFIVPHMAMSAGTILVMSGDEILMDHRSSLGSIDPQFIGPDGRPQPAQAILTGIETIKEETRKNGGSLDPVYIPILRNVDPGKLQSAINASELSIRLVRDWLTTYKFRSWTTHSSNGASVTDAERLARAEEIAEALCRHQDWLSHSRPIKIPELEKLRLKITNYGQTRELQELIWGLWVHLHHFMSSSNVYKVYESETVDLYKIALVQNQPPAAGVPQVPGQKAAPAAAHGVVGIKCNNCGTDYKIQVDFEPNQPLEPGAHRFPRDGQFQCGKCKTMHNLAGLKMQVEAMMKRPILLR